MPRLLSTALSLVVFLSCLAIPPVAAQGPRSPGEGLWRPSEIELPDPVRTALASVVRVSSPIVFEVTFYPDEASAKAAREAPDAREKTFRLDGTTVWPVHVGPSIDGACENPAVAAQPGLGEVCAAIQALECPGPPCVIESEPIAGSATGFAIGRLPDDRLVVATNYHVVREAVERHDRTAGAPEADPVDVSDEVWVEVAADPGGADWTPAAYRPVGPVELLAHASAEGWDRGVDWALLAVAGADGIEPLPRATTRPAPGDTVWVLGFPTRTVRSPEGYADAADDLRVSVGTVIDPDAVESDLLRPTDLVLTADGASGNSGSPVVNARGEVIGIVRDATHRQGEVDLRVVGYGGVTLAVPIDRVSLAGS